ncbi:efflux RND transporter periplasmic adaptor subunit [Mesorhizobium xinjiangense]|uniref:efflux RND transporter periplasmic adaptor subunit n=1 Tax=Mesorhizobium xinjiangense TaxID=2678685 RepID=UPI0012EE1658|nr:efflux RND transporter periplasmic adaptor subunit [Mesorhizobium xinjiangense]
MPMQPDQLISTSGHQRRRRGAILAVVLAVLFIAAASIWMGRAHLERLLAGLAAAPVDGGSAQADVIDRLKTPDPAPGGEPVRLVTLEPRPLVQNVALAGTVQAGRNINVAAPFDGVIEDKRVEFGTLVEKGDVLVVMDTAEIDTRLREAEAALLKARIAVEELEDWQSGPEVARSRRSVEDAEAQLDHLVRQEAELKGLLERGIVPRNEYDNLVQQLDTQRRQLAGVRQDHAVLLEKSNQTNLRLAEIELENARINLAQLEERRAGAVVRAPTSGIVTRPERESGSGASQPTQIGVRMAHGTALFSIADIGQIVVRASVDEIDLMKLGAGQGAEIVSEALPGHAPFEGRITSIGAEALTADRAGASAGIARFDVRVDFADSDGALAAGLRIGMSVTVAAKVYENVAALVVPHAALLRDGARDIVMVVDPITGARRPMPVSLGVPTQTGVEVVAGLSPGAVIAVPN